MLPTLTIAKPRLEASLHIRLANDQFAVIQKAATLAGLTPTDWARYRLHTDLNAPDLAQLAAEHTRLLLAEVLAVRSLVEELLERSTPGAPPLTATVLKTLLSGIDRQKSMGAKGMLSLLPSAVALPLKKD